MFRYFVAFLMLPLGQSVAFAQQGDAAAGKAYWDREAPRATACRNCHGNNAEGAFGPDLAGRGLNIAQVIHAVRQPWGIMPAFVESQMNDKDAADLTAYFASLPKPAAPGKWRFEVPAGAPNGQAIALNIGCAQCHGPALNGPRTNMGAVNENFAYFSNLVYNHTTAMQQHRALLGSNATNLDMGNYSRTRLSEGQLRQIFFWMRDELGFRPTMAGVLSKGEQVSTGVTYNLTVSNNGLQGKGLIAEGITVSLIVPKDSTVVAASGTGYEGTRMVNNATNAVWQLPRSAPKDSERLSITLSKAGTQADNLRGTVRWAKPGPKSGPNNDNAAIAPAPL
jgi:mono/diheme cytochrome c family protein